MFNISQNGKRLKDFFDGPSKPSHPSHPSNPSNSGCRPRRKVSTGPRRKTVRYRATKNKIDFNFILEIPSKMNRHRKIEN